MVPWLRCGGIAVGVWQGCGMRVVWGDALGEIGWCVVMHGTGMAAHYPGLDACAADGTLPQYE